MKIEKLPSGKYRIRQQYQGKRYSIVLDYKPTTKEATTLMAEKLSLSGVKSNGRTTVADAARQYIESRSNILSPTTLREYRRTNNYLLEQEPEFMTAGIDQIEQEDIQKLVNELAVGRSPKTVRNYYGFIASVFGSYRPNFHFRVDLPMKKKIDVNLPTEDEVRAILNYEEGSPFDVAFNLAVFGLRRSEVCALTMDDLDGNHLQGTRLDRCRVDSEGLPEDYRVIPPDLLAGPSGGEDTEARNVFRLHHESVGPSASGTG